MTDYTAVLQSHRRQVLDLDDRHPQYPDHIGIHGVDVYSTSEGLVGVVDDGRYPVRQYLPGKPGSRLVATITTMYHAESDTIITMETETKAAHHTAIVRRDPATLAPKAAG